MKRSVFSRICAFGVFLGLSGFAYAGPIGPTGGLRAQDVILATTTLQTSKTFHVTTATIDDIIGSTISATRITINGVVIGTGTSSSGGLVYPASSTIITPQGILTTTMTATGLIQGATMTLTGPITATTVMGTTATFSGTITGSNLTGTNTGNLTLGTTNGLQLTAQVLSLGTASTVSTGSLRAIDFNTFNVKLSSTGNGSSLTGITATQVGLGNVKNVDQTVATNITSGTILTAVLATGTANSTKYLRGDSMWATLNSTAAGLGNVTNDKQVRVADYTQKGALLVGTGTGTFSVQAPGADGLFLRANSASPTGVDYAIQQNSDFPNGLTATTGTFSSTLVGQDVQFTTATFSQNLTGTFIKATTGQFTNGVFLNDNNPATPALSARIISTTPSNQSVLTIGDIFSVGNFDPLSYKYTFTVTDLNQTSTPRRRYGGISDGNGNALSEWGINDSTQGYFGTTNLENAGYFNFGINVATITGTVSDSASTILVVPTQGNVTLNLPTIDNFATILNSWQATRAGRFYHICKIDPSTNTVTIVPFVGNSSGPITSLVAQNDCTDVQGVYNFNSGGLSASKSYWTMTGHTTLGTFQSTVTVASNLTVNAPIKGYTVTVGSSTLPINNFVQDADGDLWMVSNASYTASNPPHWDRLDITRQAYGFELEGKGIFPGETQSGLAAWVAQPAANPIISTFGVVGGWELGFDITANRDFVIGGAAIEMDGFGTFPYGRLIHSSLSAGATVYTGIGRNIYDDALARDTTSQVALFAGFVGTEYDVRFATTGTASPLSPLVRVSTYVPQAIGITSYLAANRYMFGDGTIQTTAITSSSGTTVYPASATIQGNSGIFLTTAVFVNSTTSPTEKITQLGNTGTSDLTGGAYVLDNTSNTGNGMQLYTNRDHGTQLNGLLYLKSNTTSYDEPMIYIKSNSSGTVGGNADIRMDANDVDIELVETDQDNTTGKGKFEIEAQNDTLRFNSRRSDNSQFDERVSMMHNGTLRFKELDNNGDYVGFIASTTLAFSTVWTLPPGDGTSDQVLTTDGQANLRFAVVHGISLSTQVVGNLSVTNLNSGTSATSSTFWRGDGTWSNTSAGTFSAGSLVGTNAIQSNATGSGGSQFEALDSSAQSAVAPSYQTLHLKFAPTPTFSTQGEGYFGLKSSSSSMQKEWLVIGSGQGFTTSPGATDYYKVDVTTNPLYNQYRGNTGIGIGAADAHAVLTVGGHLNVIGSTPTIQGCGTNPTLAPGSNDVAGSINIGSGGIATSCTLVFRTTWDNPPPCFANHEGAILFLQSIPTVSSVTFSASSALTAGGKINYGCPTGYQ